MSNLAELTVIGRLGADPETTFAKTGTEIVEFSVAVNTWTNGQKDDQPTWYKVTAFGRQAESLTNLAEKGSLGKGSLVYAHGEFRVRHWTTRSGDERTELKINADRVRLLGGTDGP